MEQEASKHTPIKLIRDEFKATMHDIKALTPQDRLELGTGIARNMGLTQEQCDFVMCEY